MNKHSKEVREIVSCKYLLVDEVSMLNKYTFKAIDLLLQDLCCSSESFGGKIMLLCGDFKQLPCVVVHGSRFDV